MNLIYGLAVLCTIDGTTDCTTAEHEASPYTSRAECLAAHEGFRQQISHQRMMLTLQHRQPVRVWEVCDTLDRIRSVIPDAFEGHAIEEVV